MTSKSGQEIFGFLIATRFVYNSYRNIQEKQNRCFLPCYYNETMPFG